MALPNISARVVLALAAVTLAACASDEPAGDAEAKPPAELRASVDRTVATTGDLITYTVEVERDPGVEVELDEPGADIAGFRIVDLGRAPVETLASGRLLERRWYDLRADLVGSYVLPALTATYGEAAGDGPGGDLEAGQISVEVESVLPEDRSEATDIRDIKPLRRIDTAASWLLWTGLALAAAALGLAAWWWWRRRRPDGGAPEAPPVPPYDLAIGELERLRRTDFSDLRELRRYYFAVSAVIRAYVEGRFGLNATDLTTEEILGRLGGLVRLEPLQARRLERFLVATDQVKFAAHLPAPEEIERTYERALGFVTATRPREDAEDGESAAPAAEPAGKAA
ncbi:MAG: protein BatD [Holophagales bacterium]|nr:protein BatD [Holophagales bacterium]MYF96299.1 protein BatD [Holophagales bacterium]